ncbi:MAG: extracellular solute-binding protein, partial [Spirochaetales bacterium]|nr:extracellular solute-binding protein [Spirochaetales bacterium]
MKKVLAIMLIALTVCTMVFAQAAAEKSDKVQLRVLNYIDMSEPNSANEIAQVWDKFTAEHPEIEIIREDLFNEPFHQKVEAYAAQGQLPDVMYAWPSGRSSTLHTEGLLYDLTGLLKRDGLFDKYNPLCTAPQLAGYLGELPNGVTATSMMFV